ncbi:5'-adenylylsulfate reductase-like [Actinidia chinensis var. chinensis]|uniref:5'-adenylylsulfate reductase-like n=1 Tax=Actinidia chinensis var. chinensis TaxID=1590841 RepID=A0A2R6RUL7_ACTCC|nr:5'-adenylylsulfate reductase-like [Actinidia chinensis var. chinensis]
MAESMKYVVLICIIVTTASSIRYVTSSSVSSSMCLPQSNTFVRDLLDQCHRTTSYSLPIKMDAESVDRTLSSSQTNVYTAVLFYASWCPFSSDVRSKFAALSSMFPQIKHVMVEQSSAMPSVLSRYGIHSLPSMLIVNQTARVRYHGPKDLTSFVLFYKRTTGLHPVADVTEDQGSYSESGHKVHPWNGNSLKEILMREPYLVFSVLFLFLRVFLYFFPNIISCLIALWVACLPHLNVAIFGESRQFLGRVLYLVDIKRVWGKLKICKNRNFHNGARSARVWASSFTSVSLGETSSVRSPALGDS